MKSHLWTRILTAILILAAFAPSSAVAPKHGWLKTDGPDLLNQDGKIVQLRGMSFYWSTPSWDGAKYYTSSTVSTLTGNEWKCTVLRAAYDRDKGHDNGWSQCQTVIDAAIAAGIYVIIDWHAYDAHNYQSAAVSFFTEQAKKYKSTPNVIFEPYNEPITAGGATGGTQDDAEKTWAAIKPYLTAVTQAIRDQGAENLVILGTPYYSQFVNVAAQNQPKDKAGNYFKNVAYTFHFYAASHGQNAYYIKNGTQTGGMEPKYLEGGVGKVPIFVTEWGTTHNDGGANGHTYIDETNTDWWFTNYIDKFHISHCNWSVSALEASSCFSSGTSLSASGKAANKHIKTSATDVFDRVSDLGNSGPAKDSVFSMPGYHPAAGFNRYYGGNISSSDFTVPYIDRDAIDVQNAANTCVKVLTGASNDWIRYYLKAASATKKIAVRWLAKAGSGNLEVKLNRVSAGSIKIQKNSAWVTSVLDLNVPAGNDTLEFNCTTDSGAGYIIEWFRLADDISGVGQPLSLQTAPARAATIFPIAGGFDVRLPLSHDYTLYKLFGVDGKKIRSGAVRSGQSLLRLSAVPCGGWFLELGNDRGSMLLPAMVR
jgi:endoglucanase